jgi:drug/metabolite transporter (DMT)-like permease
MGEIYALSCALVWAFAVILLKRSGLRVAPFPLNLFRVCFSVPLIVLTMLVAGVPFAPPVAAGDTLMLVLSGILGIAVADTLFHRSLNLIGAGITAIIDTIYSPLTVLLAYAFLHEHLGALDLVGMGLILGAVLISATLEVPGGRTRRELLVGIGLGVAAIVFLVVGIVIAKPVLNRAPVLWAVGMRQVGSLVVMMPIALASPRRGQILSVLRPSGAWRTMAPAAFLGSYVALILWVAGFKFTLASIAAILTQSATVFILILAVLLLGERLTVRKVLAAALALAGVLLVTLR